MCPKRRQGWWRPIPLPAGNLAAVAFKVLGSGTAVVTGSIREGRRMLRPLRQGRMSHEKDQCGNLYCRARQRLLQMHFECRNPGQAAGRRQSWRVEMRDTAVVIPCYNESERLDIKAFSEYAGRDGRVFFSS